MSFSNWLEEQKDQSAGLPPRVNALSFGGMFGATHDDRDLENNIENGGSSQMLSFDTSGVNIPSDLGWSNMKSTLEAQMPQKVLGMGYHQRFKVRN